MSEPSVIPPARREYSPINARLRPEAESTLKRREPGIDNQPISLIEWVEPDKLTANDWNPNRVSGDKMRLIKVSLLEAGWCAAITVCEGDDDTLHIIDGFHRWSLAKLDPAIRALGEGRVPIVRQDRGRVVDVATRIASTVRMNRASGDHYVVGMAEVVAKLVNAGVDDEEIAERLGMEEEEVFRLKQRGRMSDPAVFNAVQKGDASEIPEEPGFGPAWAPDHDADVGAQENYDRTREAGAASRRGRRKTEPVVGKRGRD